MTIGFDVTMLVYSGSGVANYTFHLVKALLEIDRKNEYHLFYSSFRRPKNFYYLDELNTLGAKVYEYPFPPSLLKIIWGKLDIIPIEWFTNKVDIFFFSDFLRPPLLAGTKGVTTIHDLTWKLFPEYHTKEIINAHENKIQKTIKYGDKIIVDSKNTMIDLLRLFPQIDNNKVSVIYPGISKEFKIIFNGTTINNTLKKYDIDNDSKFLLYVGAIEPRKNLTLAIEVFDQLKKDEKYKDYKFIITGKAGWKNQNVFQMVEQLKLKDKVKFIGFVEDEDLPHLYNAANLTVYLSSYEGFGLPPLESLACGTPTIAGDNSSMKEMIEKKFLVDITDENKILEKMKYLLTNKIEVNSKGVREKFAWKNSADKFLKIVTDLTD